jgi:T-complex protein 1 subunit zeta
MLQQAQRYLNEGVHPTVLIEGIHLARNEAQHFLEKYQQEMKKIKVDREVLLNVAKTTLKTKLHEKLAEKMSDIIVDSVQTIQMPNEPIDLFMVEIMHMKHRSDDETRFVNGLVLDHGARHPDMPKSIKNCYIMTLNVSLEYEKRFVYIYLYLMFFYHANSLTFSIIVRLMLPSSLILLRRDSVWLLLKEKLLMKK